MHSFPSSHLQAPIVGSGSGSSSAELPRMHNLTCLQRLTCSQGLPHRPASSAPRAGRSSRQCGSRLLQQPGHAPLLTRFGPCEGALCLFTACWALSCWVAQAGSLCAAAADSCIGTVRPWLLPYLMAGCTSVIVGQPFTLPPHPAQELNAAGLVNVVWSIAKTDHASRLTHRLLEAVAGEGS